MQRPWRLAPKASNGGPDHRASPQRRATPGALHLRRSGRGAKALSGYLRRLHPASPLVLTVVVVVAAFGPYLVGSVRTEQAVVYGLTLLSVPLVLTVRPSRPLAAVAALWGIYAALLLLGWGWAGWQFGREVVAGVDNMVLPLCVMWLACALATYGDPSRLLRVAGVALVCGMLVNLLAALMSLMFGVEWGIFWSASNDQPTAYWSLRQGRATGLVNQPAEAGLMYGLAAATALYLWAGRWRLLLPIIAALVVGGMLTVSKGFVLIALPIIAWQLVRPHRWRFYLLGAGAIAGFSTVVAAAAGWLDAWSTGAQLGRMVPSRGESWVGNFTGNRFGENSTLRPVIDAVVDGPWLIGFGPEGLPTSYDNAWIEAFVQTGALGVGLFTAVVAALTVAWWRMPRGPERRLMGVVLLITVGSAVGVPAFTVNRAATVLWLLLGLLLSRRMYLTSSDARGRVEQEKLRWDRLPFTTSKTAVRDA